MNFLANSISIVISVCILADGNILVGYKFMQLQKKKKKNLTAILPSNNHLGQFHRVRKEISLDSRCHPALCTFLVGPKCPCSSVVCSASQSLSRVRLCAAPLTVARQAPLSMGFFMQEYWSRLQFPTAQELSDPGIEPVFPALAGGVFTTVPPWKPN